MVESILNGQYQLIVYFIGALTIVYFMFKIINHYLKVMGLFLRKRIRKIIKEELFLIREKKLVEEVLDHK